VVWWWCGGGGGGGGAIEIIYKKRLSAGTGQLHLP
jgi:hypothetical protein